MPEFIMQLAVKASGPKPESVEPPAKQVKYSRGRPPTDTESAQGILWVLDEKATTTLPAQIEGSQSNRPFDPQFLAAVELFCTSDLSFEAAQQAVIPSEPPRAAIFVPHLLPTARAIFGDLIEAVYFAEDDDSEWSRRRLRKRVLDCKNNTKQIDMDGASVVLRFTNGKLVSFGASEWGVIEGVQLKS